MQRTIEILGNGLRTQVLHHLAQQSMTAKELAERAGLHYSSVHRHLSALEREGLVTADHPQDKRRGAYVKVRWSPNPARISEVAAEWSSYALGSGD